MISFSSSVVTGNRVPPLDLARAFARPTLGMTAQRRPPVLAALVICAGACTVQGVDYSQRSCEQAVDCPTPYVCVRGATAQTGVCVVADQGVPITDGGSCDVTSISFNRDVQPTFTAHCGLGGCHSPINPAGELNLTAPGTVARLVNQPTSSQCSFVVPNVPRVKPGDTRGSMIWRKTSDDPTKCLDAMPLPIPLKTAYPCEFARLEAWIQQGAPDN
jgi:hypothetical protein